MIKGAPLVEEDTEDDGEAFVNAANFANHSQHRIQLSLDLHSILIQPDINAREDEIGALPHLLGPLGT